MNARTDLEISIPVSTVLVRILRIHSFSRKYMGASGRGKFPGWAIFKNKAITILKKVMVDALKIIMHPSYSPRGTLERDIRNKIIVSYQDNFYIYREASS